ncbi:SGNH/GDSL hydrolase family protein [Riemerella columbipharyngis]|uniref:GDSL-like Lipase/Acylhydrolase n=1 Tax=Riemerella columbipharyngis TaxID=1071918 RepID=A0A1G7CYU7_9FLAO|nr:SGNH/GDSL hydrolase family protein [Riemerella columbipharyngis]SDE43655.1 GDSL-like Lipase/Acylhydrolase [Riemerella columbipharyngis]
MKKLFTPLLATSLVLTLSSCHTDFPTDVANIKTTSGEADFSRYVALGNSLTSGFRDGTLYADGQKESYPNIIAEQMKKAGGGYFTQPMMPNNVGGFKNIPGFSGKYVLKAVNGQLAPVALPAEADLDMVKGQFNNMGVPGAKSYHLLASGYGNQAGLALGKANPYFVRFASSPSSSVIQDAMTQKPTFFSLWIGNNDVLTYATNGGDGVDQTGNTNPTTYGNADISDPMVVAGSIETLIRGMQSAGARQGVIANIPNVTSIPFFTTIPYNPVPLTAIEAEELNKRVYAPLIAILKMYGQEGRFNLVKEGEGNPLLIKDKSLVDYSTQITAALIQAKALPSNLAAIVGNLYGQARQTTKEDLIPLTTRSVIGAPSPSPYDKTPFDRYGVTYPLDDKYVLTKDETANVLKATAAYNAAIKQLADKYQLAFVDANAKMQELSSQSGIQYNGVNYGAKYITGGAFSLDGVHLTGRGYSIIANEFIKAINAKYHSTLPEVNPNRYSGVTFP